MEKLVTINDLIAQKIKKEEKQNETIEIAVGDMENPLTFRKLTENEFINFMDMNIDNKSMEKNIKAIDWLIYTSCPMLQNTQLHEQLGIQDPDDVPSVLWTITDRINLSDKLSDFMELNDKKEEIKNF